jgi:hypothetical protein
MRHRFLILLLGCSAALSRPGFAASDEMPKNDLREFHVGESVASLPRKGYLGFACAGAATGAGATEGGSDAGLSGWSDYVRCPADANGLHAVAFRYDVSEHPMAQVSEATQGTEVAGQPVLLQLLIDKDAHLAGIRIATDPSTRLHEHRGAYLFGVQAKARYGASGWQCTMGSPTPTEQPIGGSFVKEHCEKQADGRHYFIDRDLHRDPGLELSHFVSASTVLILKADAPGAKGGS